MQETALGPEEPKKKTKKKKKKHFFDAPSPPPPPMPSSIAFLGPAADFDYLAKEYSEEEKL